MGLSAGNPHSSGRSNGPLTTNEVNGDWLQVVYRRETEQVKGAVAFEPWWV